MSADRDTQAAPAEAPSRVYGWAMRLVAGLLGLLALGGAVYSLLLTRAEAAAHGYTSQWFVFASIGAGQAGCAGWLLARAVFGDSAE